MVPDAGSVKTCHEARRLTHLRPMHRFYLPPEQCRDDSVLTLSDREAHHGLRVLRVRRGERLVVLDGAGHEFLCEAREVSPDAIQLAVLQKNAIPPLPYQLTLVQAIPKGKIIESIIQKATELGEHEPNTSILAAFDLPLIGSLQPGSRHPRQWFKAFQDEHRRMPQSVSVWIGPEGDFTPAEISAAKSAGALPITLGRLVLRTETAALYCLSVLNYELQAGSGGGS